MRAEIVARRHGSNIDLFHGCHPCGNAFADTMQTRGFRRKFRFCDMCLISLAPRAGFEPATIRLTVECSTAELPRNRRNLFATGERITKPPSLAKDEMGRCDAAPAPGRNSPCGK